MADPNRRPLLWVVDDDPELRSLLQEFLEKQGFDVRLFPDGRDVERRMARERPDLLVLDYMLPGEDGFTLCRRIRAVDDVGIIMLTARSDVADRIAGIECGADDYLGKPFSAQELVVRIRAILRRRALVPGGAPLAGEDDLSFGPFRIDFATRTLWRGGGVPEPHHGGICGARSPGPQSLPALYPGASGGTHPGPGGGDFRPQHRCADFQTAQVAAHRAR